MNARKRTECNCIICGKQFYPSGKMSGKYCSRECADIGRVKSKYEEYLQNPSLYRGTGGMKWVKKHILQEQDRKCDICGCGTTWNNKPLVFILDHIDGHANNNSGTNLRLICPNCDSQLDTYKSKNKNSDRVYYHNHHR